MVPDAVSAWGKFTLVLNHWQETKEGAEEDEAEEQEQQQEEEKPKPEDKKEEPRLYSRTIYLPFSLNRFNDREHK